MEFEGEDQRNLNELVRTLSGRLDLLIDQPPQRAAGGGGGGGSTSAEESRGPSLSEDEPPECRVCRGEPEPGRRLYAPCLCSGSIMHTHEDCLLEWLEHSGKDTCELCGAQFHFTPVYDPDAPQYVPIYQVLSTCARKAVVKWLPLLVRVVMVAVLWVVFVPVCTSWLYRIWIHRTRVLLPQLFLQRLNAACIWSDCISGIIVTAAIILSFLSLMTFADFLADQLLRDDFGGIGLDGMNLVEAMAEGLDELRFDNNNNHNHDRAPPPPQEALPPDPPQGDRGFHRGGGGGGGGGANAAPFVPPADAAPTVHETRIRTPSVGAAEGAVNAGRDYHNGNFVETMDAAYASMGDRGVAEPVSRSRTNDDGSPGDRGHVANEHRANKNNGAFGGVRGVGSGEGKSPTVNRGGTEPRAGSTETGRRSNATDFASSGEWYRGRKASGRRASHGVWLDDHEEKWEKEEEEKEGDKATRAAFVELNSRPPTPPRKARMEDAGTSYEALSAVSAAAEVTAGARGAAARSGSGNGSGRGSGRSSGNGKGEPPHGAGGAMHQGVAMTGIDPVAAASAPSVGREGLIDRKYGRTPPPPPPPTRATNAEAAQSSMRGTDDDLASAVSTNGASGSSAMARATERGSVGNAQPQDRLPMEQAEPAAAAVAGAGAGAALGAGPGPGLGPGADRAQEPPPLLGEEDDLDDLEDGFLDGDLDVHMAIDELLGIRGPVTVLLRNVLWLLAFHGAYLGLFAFFPFSIGASVIHAISKYLDPHVLASLGRRSEYLALRDVVQEWFVLATSSEEQEDTLRLSDLATICLGYMVMSAMVFMWRGIINAISNRTNTQILLRAKKAMRVISAVVKVGLLLSLKMLLLPLLLGVCLDATTLSLFGRTGESRARFMAQHLVGSLLLHWVLGITFMLFVTVSVLQLREVVHPELLSLIIRPQEPHPDLLGSLLQESGRTHARRMAMSLAIYLALVVMFVWVPTRLVGALFPSIMPVQLELRYGMPQLQIPAELVILHLAMLTFLERYQNRIGEMQHAWLVAACGRLGLTRYVLPQPVVARLTRPRRPTDGVSDAAASGGINNPAVSGVVPGTDAGANFGADGGAGASSLRRRWTSSRGPARQGASSATRGDGCESAGGGGGEADGGVGGGRGWGAKLKAWWDGGEAGKDEEEGIIVGPPLRRPPTGWDDPAGVAQGRWAWGTEPPGEVQLNLAPRRRHGARVVPLMALLLLAAWVTVLVVSMCILVLPFLVGRLVFSLLHLPRHWTHDTASFAVGLTLLKAAIPSLYRGWCMAREAFVARNRHAAADLVVFASELATRTEASIATLRAERDEMLRRMAYEVGRRGGGRELDQLQQHVQEQNENIEKLVQQLNRLNDETAVARASALRDQQLLRQQQQPHTDTNSDDVDPQLRAAAAVGAAATAATATAARRKSTVRGATTLLAAAVLWLVVAPLLAAGLYETAFVVTAQEWASKGPLGALPCWNQPVRTLALGVFLLHVWVYFCRARIPRWVAAAMWAVGVGVGGARGAGHGEAAPQLGGGGAGADADGGAALQEPDRQSFWGARIEAALLQIEAGLSWGRWSEVSARPLLGNFVGAVVLRLFAMIAISATVSLAAGAWTGPDGADGQLVQLRHFRAALLALVLTRASTYLIKPTQVWLKALHDGVRDDRYLVGMRLQDHSDKGQDTGVGDNSNNVEGMAAAAAAAAATTAGLG